MIESTDSVFVEEAEEITEQEYFADPEQDTESVFYEEIEPEIIEIDETQQEDVFSVTSFTSEVEEGEEILPDQEEIEAQADPEQAEQIEQAQVVYLHGVNEESGSDSVTLILDNIESMLSDDVSASDLARIDSRLDEMNDTLLIMNQNVVVASQNESKKFDLLIGFVIAIFGAFLVYVAFSKIF